MTAISNLCFFYKKKILSLPWLSILTQDHGFSEDEELEDLDEEIDEYPEGKKNIPVDEANDNLVEKVLIDTTKKVWWYVLKSWDPA